MKKHKIVGFIVFIFVAIIPAVAAAAVNFNNSTLPFGGRVLTTTVPSVTCTPPGTGPVVLISNIVSLGSAVYSGANNQQSGVQRAAGVVSGVYNALPYYATDPTKTPKPGQWILGRASLIPDLSLCYSAALGGFPVPVKKTTTYGVSGQTWRR